jgi:hypothetical protein
MSKIVCCGDTHGRAFWKLIHEMEKPYDRMIFIGDYFDSFDIDSETQQRNFKEICEFKEKEGDKVILLLGNHDTSYILGDICSGYQYGAEHNIKHLHSTYKDLTQMVHYEGNILFTHAGVGETWLQKHYPDRGQEYSAKIIAEEVNDLWKYKPNSFVFDGYDGYGDDMGQVPVWIRPKSLLKDTKEIRKAGVIQIVGHTQVTKIDIEGSKKNTGGKLFMIDALGTSREYLVIENEEFIVKKC